MDPNTTLLWVLQAIADKRRGDAIDALIDLAGWLRNRGFLPNARTVAAEFLDRATNDGPTP